MYWFFLVAFVGETVYAHILMFKHYHLLSGIGRSQIKYIFLGTSIGFLGGSTNYPLWYDIPFPPYGNILVSVYVVLVAYAIIKYHLMDIRLAVTKAGIFLFIYLFVLGVPFWLGFRYRLWQHATWIAILLATAGPFIYIYLKHKAEAHLLQEERRIQQLLLKASYGMNTIHDIQKLLGMIEDALVNILNVKHAGIYLRDKDGRRYTPAPAGQEGAPAGAAGLPADDPFIAALRKTRFPIVQEELRRRTEQAPGPDTSAPLARTLKALEASVVVPVIIDGTLLGFFTLGERASQQIYSDELLNALMVLGNQAALAIENCRHMAAETKRVQEEGLRERMESLDHMASSMAHEIDNPMHGVRTSLAFIKDFIMKDPRYALAEPLDNDLTDAIQRIESCGERVSGMIKAILDYSRMGTGQLMPTSINDAVRDFQALIQPQLKKDKVDFDLRVEDGLPLVLGDKIQIEEILMNFTRNSLHAVRQRDPKKISLRIFRKDEAVIRIECADNGYGIKPELLNDIFLSSMTTKGSTEGTGLGLYRVRKIVDLFKGRVWAESGGEGKGAVFIVELPVFSGKLEERLKELNAEESSHKDHET